MRAAVPALFLVACGSSSSATVDAHHADSAKPIDAYVNVDDGEVDIDGAVATDGTVAIDGAITVDAAVDAMTTTVDAAPAGQVLRINEVLANATNCDLVELRAIAGGDLTGLRLMERKDIVYTFPAMTVAPDALIVVHFGAAAGGPCHNDVSPDETVAPNQYPKAQYAGNYDTAYDLFSTDAGLVATDNVISIMKTTTVIDAVLLSDGPTGTAAGDSEDQAAVVAAQGQWVKVGGGVPTGGFIDDDFNANAALNLAAAPTMSIQRLDNTDDNDKADWNTATVTSQPSTFGALNAGQTPL